MTPARPKARWRAAHARVVRAAPLAVRVVGLALALRQVRRQPHARVPARRAVHQQRFAPGVGAGLAAQSIGEAAPLVRVGDRAPLGKRGDVVEHDARLDRLARRRVARQVPPARLRCPTAAEEATHQLGRALVELSPAEAEGAQRCGGEGRASV